MTFYLFIFLVSADAQESLVYAEPTQTMAECLAKAQNVSLPAEYTIECVTTKE